MIWRLVLILWGAHPDHSPEGHVGRDGQGRHGQAMGSENENCTESSPELRIFVRLHGGLVALAARITAYQTLDFRLFRTAADGSGDHPLCGSGTAYLVRLNNSHHRNN